MRWIAFGLALLNVVAWASYRVDKARAVRGARRIPERVLLGLALIGGSAGALIAVYAHRRRHKARKWRFVILLWAIAAVHVAIAIVTSSARSA